MINHEWLCWVEAVGLTTLEIGGAVGVAVSIAMITAWLGNLIADGHWVETLGIWICVLLFVGIICWFLGTLIVANYGYICHVK